MMIMTIITNIWDKIIFSNVPRIGTLGNHPSTQSNSSLKLVLHPRANHLITAPIISPPILIPICFLQDTIHSFIHLRPFINSQYPPLSGPTRRIIFCSFIFLICSSAQRFDFPRRVAISLMVTSGFSSIICITFSTFSPHFLHIF